MHFESNKLFLFYCSLRIIGTTKDDPDQPLDSDKMASAVPQEQQRANLSKLTVRKFYL